MKAYLKKEFKKGFLLSEENLIKLNDIVLKRLKENNEEALPKYKVFREDSLVYETTDYSNIVEEENSARNKISAVHLFCESENFKLKLSFEKQADTFLEIEAKNKDFAYLLFSDIKEYITTEVLKFRSFIFKNSQIERLMMPIIFLIILMASPLVSNNGPDVDKIGLHNLLESGTVDQKLNILIEYSYARSDLGRMPYFVGVILLIVILIYTTFPVLDRLYPRNIFYIGKEILSYDNLLSVRSKVYWVIIAGLVVSIVGGFIVYFVTN